jgi:hypothetical protein
MGALRPLFSVTTAPADSASNGSLRTAYARAVIERLFPAPNGDPARVLLHATGRTALTAKRRTPIAARRDGGPQPRWSQRDGVGRAGAVRVASAA